MFWFKLKFSNFIFFWYSWKDFVLKFSKKESKLVLTFKNMCCLWCSFLPWHLYKVHCRMCQLLAAYWVPSLQVWWHLNHHLIHLQCLHIHLLLYQPCLLVNSLFLSLFLLNIHSLLALVLLMFNLIISGAYMGLQVHNNELPSRYHAGLSFLYFFFSNLKGNSAQMGPSWLIILHQMPPFWLLFILLKANVVLFLFENFPLFFFFFVNLGSVVMGH